MSVAHFSWWLRGTVSKYEPKAICRISQHAQAEQERWLILQHRGDFWAVGIPCWAEQSRAEELGQGTTYQAASPGKPINTAGEIPNWCELLWLLSKQAGWCQLGTWPQEEGYLQIRRDCIALLRLSLKDDPTSSVRMISLSLGAGYPPCLKKKKVPVF